MMQQRDDMIHYLLDNAQNLNLTDGFHWVAHSQGSLLARAVIQQGLSSTTSSSSPRFNTTDRTTSYDDKINDAVVLKPDTFISMGK